MLREFRFGLYSATGKPHHGDQVHSKGIPFVAAAICKGWPIYSSLIKVSDRLHLGNAALFSPVFWEVEKNKGKNK